MINEQQWSKTAALSAISKIDDLIGTRPTVEQLEEILFYAADNDCRLYCIMDGFWAVGLYGRLLGCSDISWAHLFQGDVATRHVQQAPFIIALEKGHKLTRWLLNQGWGQGWGMYFTVSTVKAKRHYGAPFIHDKRFLPSNEEDIKLGNLVDGEEDVLWAVRRHFRRFSDVVLEDSGKIVDFRYYDPEALHIYLAGCCESERRQFFGPIDYFYSEVVNIDYSRRDCFIIGRYHKEMQNDRAVGYELNLKTGKRNPITLLPSHTGQEEKHDFVYVMIRAAHCQEFEKQQQKKFLHKVTYALCLQMNGSMNNVLYYNIYQRVEQILQNIDLQKNVELHVTALITIHFFDLYQKFSCLSTKEQNEIMDGFSLADVSHSLRKLL